MTRPNALRTAEGMEFASLSHRGGFGHLNRLASPVGPRPAITRRAAKPRTVREWRVLLHQTELELIQARIERARNAARSPKR